MSTGFSGSRGWLVGGLLATAAAIGVLGVTAWSWAVAPQARTEDQTRTYRHAVSRVELDLTAGHITVSAGDAGQVTVHRRLQWRAAEPVVREDWSGDTLRISAACPERQNHCAVDYTVRVPAGVAVQAATDAGDLAVRDLTGDVRLTTGSGETDIDHLAGPLRVRSGDGDVTATGLRSATTDVDTRDGRVELRYDTAPTTVRVLAVDGGITITVPDRATAGADGDDDYRVSADTEDGDRAVTVRQNWASRHSITATTTTGDVTVGYR